MTSSNPNSPTNSPLNFRPFALGKRGQKFRFIPTNAIGLAKPVIAQALQTAGDVIQVTWGESGGTSYALQVSTDGGTTFSDVTTTAGTSFTHTGLSFPGSYTYRVRAILDAEVSDWSDNVTETMVDVPAGPSGLTVTGATISSISLSWSDTVGEDFFTIESSPDGFAPWTFVSTTSANTTTFTHSGLSESIQRYYRVIANNKAGGSLPSSTTNSWTVPAAPTGLSATAISTTQIDLSWTDVSTGNTSYKVERSTDNSTWTEIATGLSATATTYSATGLTASTQYWFRVRAANAARNSDYSSSATATTQASTTVPNAPSGFNATSTFADSVSLSWTDNSSGTGQETGFDIEVSTNAGSTYSSVVTTAANATSYSHTGRVESTTYLYRIRATNSAGSSSWVVGDNVTTTAAITGFTATAASSTQINLAWTDKSGVETGFRIERSTDNTNWSLVTTTAANATSFSNTGLNASTLYYYRIRSNSYNGTNDSAWYSASATTQSGALSPSWTLDFSSGTPSGYTLTRASSATRVDSSGYIASSSTDVARLTHNSSGSRLGLLVEGQRTNGLLRSQDWSATWVLAGLTQSANATTSPDGTSNATRLVEQSGVTGHETYQTSSSTNQMVFSVYIKADQRTAVSLSLYRSSNDWAVCTFDLSTGTAGNTAVGTSSGWSNVAASIESVGNDWYRCAIRATHSSSSTIFVAISLNSTTTPTRQASNGIEVYSGNTANGLFVWGAQTETQNTAPTSYISTTTASVTRSADLVHVLDTSITSWGDPGALVVHFYPPGQAGTLISTDDASTAQVGIEASTTTAARAFWSSGSTSTGTIGSGVQKAVHYWNGSTSKFCINGGTVQSGTNNLTIANTDFVTLGAEATDSAGVPGTFSQYANCVIRKVEFYSGTLTDANLQTITT